MYIAFFYLSTVELYRSSKAGWDKRKRSHIIRLTEGKLFSVLRTKITSEISLTSCDPLIFQQVPHHLPSQFGEGACDRWNCTPKLSGVFRCILLLNAGLIHVCKSAYLKCLHVPKVPEQLLNPRRFLSSVSQNYGGIHEV